MRGGGEINDEVAGRGWGCVRRGAAPGPSRRQLGLVKHEAR